MKRYYFKCPKCRSDEKFRHIQQEFPSILTQLAVWPSLVGKRRQVQCKNCHYIFGMPGIPVSSISKLSLFIIVTLFVTAIGTLVLSAEPNMFVSMNDNIYLKLLEEYVSQNSKAVTLGITFLVIFLIPLLIIWSMIGEYLYRKSFKEKYWTNPEQIDGRN